MAIFEEVRLAWKDDEIVIPANRVLSAIAVVEEQITFSELISCMQRAKPPLVAISKAFAGVLRFGGLRVTDEEVYAGMFETNVAERVIHAVNTLLMMMTPPAALATPAATVAPAAKAKPGNAAAGARKPSKASTKPRLAPAT